MPNNKNQHYVPRCLLKPFTLNREGLAINVFNIARRRAIPNAPVKSQCSQDYFYGRDDLRAEKLLASLEGEFTRVLGKLQSGNSADQADKHWLKLFALIQWRRTAAQLAELRRYKESMENAAFARDPTQKPEDLSDRDLMAISVRSGVQGIKYTEDLKVSIFRNLSGLELIISDNPSVLTNRLHLQRWKQNRFGMSSSGAILSMPLSPELSFVAYDGAAYTTDRSGDGFVDLKHDHDIRALNGLQFLVAEKNLYFSPNQDYAAFADQIDEASAEREMAVPDTQVLIPIEGSKGAYRSAKPGEEMTARQMLLATSFRYPTPSSWPSKLRMREKVKTFENGSAVGHVRKAEWLTSKERTT
jgi:hypothetical protein